jgi:hypothetical protein
MKKVIDTFGLHLTPPRDKHDQVSLFQYIQSEYIRHCIVDVVVNGLLPH